MKDPVTPEDQDVLLTIQNNKNPDQGIFLVIDESREHVETQGLQAFFGLKEIRIATQDIVESLHEYAQVLSFILETISTAEELGLPYSYQNEFRFGDAVYTLYEEGEHRFLKKAAA